MLCQSNYIWPKNVIKTEKLCLFDNISLLWGSYRLNANEVYSQCMFNSVIPLWGLSMKVFAQICTSCTPNVRCSEAYTPYQSALRGPVTPWPASFKQISFHIPSRPSLHFDKQRNIKIYPSPYPSLATSQRGPLKPLSWGSRTILCVFRNQSAMIGPVDFNWSALQELQGVSEKL